jgi:hypothetical protein
METGKGESISNKEIDGESKWVILSNQKYLMMAFQSLDYERIS